MTRIAGPRDCRTHEAGVNEPYGLGSEFAKMQTIEPARQQCW